MAENANLDAARSWAVERGDAGGAFRLMQALDFLWPYAIPPKPRRLERLAAVLALPLRRRRPDRPPEPGVGLLRGRPADDEGAGAGPGVVPRSPSTHFRVLGHEGGEAAALGGLMEASLLAW